MPVHGSVDDLQESERTMNATVCNRCKSVIPKGTVIPGAIVTAEDLSFSFKPLPGIDCCETCYNALFQTLIEQLKLYQEKAVELQCTVAKQIAEAKKGRRL